MQYYYFTKPRSSSFSVCGRGTKGFIGLDMSKEEPRVVFIKDYWYPAQARSELAVYDVLHTYQVPNIASIIAGGDVESQSTQVTRNHDLLVKGPTKRVHHRIVTSTIGRPFDTNKNQKELLECAHDAFKGTKSDLSSSQSCVMTPPLMKLLGRALGSCTEISAPQTCWLMSRLARFS